MGSPRRSWCRCRGWGYRQRTRASLRTRRQRDSKTELAGRRRHPPRSPPHSSCRSWCHHRCHRCRCRRIRRRLRRRPRSRNTCPLVGTRRCSPDSLGCSWRMRYRIPYRHMRRGRPAHRVVSSRSRLFLLGTFLSLSSESTRTESSTTHRFVTAEVSDRPGQQALCQPEAGGFAPENREKVSCRRRYRRRASSDDDERRQVRLRITQAG